ncbi:MAG TPA: membrane protein insertion efficiency factor YidD [Candidatus Paceibacterota bacterium]|nr:membrane protein insertion efficiency factor YidD [Candidatus Paceibacterota bacterium]
MNPVQHILILLVRLYRCTLSPAKMFLFGPSGCCRFEPSCSEYALDAVKAHGAVSGVWLATKRICRCHPYGGCGYDPVPSCKQHIEPLPASGLNPAQSK